MGDTRTPEQIQDSLKLQRDSERLKVEHYLTYDTYDFLFSQWAKESSAKTVRLYELK